MFKKIGMAVGIALTTLFAFTAGAQAQQMTVTKSWNGSYNPNRSATDAEAAMRMAATERGAENGTLGVPGQTNVTNVTQNTIGNLNEITVQNGDGTVTIGNNVDQKNKIGTQSSTAKVVTVIQK